MRTAEINERVILGAVKRSWCTSREILDELDAPESALRKVTSMLFVLMGVKKLEGRIRRSAVVHKGRPPMEFRRA